MSSAFVAAVVPWKIIADGGPAGRRGRRASEASARSKASPGSSGVDGTLAISTRPSEVVAIASVKVPPMSMPTTQPVSSATAACPGQFPDSRRHLAGEQVERAALQVPWQAGEVRPGNEVQVAAGCPAVPVDLLSDLRRIAEHDRGAQRVVCRRRSAAGAGRGSPCPGPRGLHVVVFPGDVAVIVPDASSGASGGKNNATTNGDYQTGMAVFTIAKGGLMFAADISGEKFVYTARPEK